MGLRARIKAVTTETGPRSKNILKGLARGEKQRAQFESVFQSMLDNGELVMRESDKRWAKYGPPGFGTTQLLVVVVIIGLLAGFGLMLRGFEHRGYERGRAEVMAAWEKAKVEAIEAGQARDREVLHAIDTAHAKAESAEALAAENERRWKEANREAHRNRVALGTCTADWRAGRSGGTVGQTGNGGAGVDQAPPAGGDPAGAPSVRLSWAYVGLHDYAFTGLDGEPVFRDSSAFALVDSRANTASPYGLDELLAVNVENARALSACRRHYQEALSEIDAGAAAWGKGPQ